MGSKRSVDAGSRFIEGEDCQGTSNEVADLPIEAFAVPAGSAIKQLPHGDRGRELLGRRHLGNAANKWQGRITPDRGAEDIRIEAIHDSAQIRRRAVDASPTGRVDLCDHIV